MQYVPMNITLSPIAFPSLKAANIREKAVLQENLISSQRFTVRISLLSM